MSEYTGRVPVASLRKRNVYKTEFDIFKQNTDIDLISLISYDEERPEIDFKVSYRDFKSGASKISSVTSSHNSEESHRSIKSLVRSSLINKEKEKNPQIKGDRQKERACKSAINYKGINSRCCDVNQRSKTAFGSRVVERKTDYIKTNLVTDRNNRNICSKYKSCSRTSQNREVLSERKTVRSVSAYGYTRSNSIKLKGRNGHGPVVNSPYNQRIRPKTVSGLRNETRNSNKLENDKIESSEVLNVDILKDDCNAQGNGAAEDFLEGSRTDISQLEQRNSLFSQGNDLSECIKADDCLDSKDSGYQGSECSPDLDKVKEDVWIANSDQNLAESAKEGLEASSVKKQVSFEEFSDSKIVSVDLEEGIESVSLEEGDIVSDLDDESEKASVLSTKDTFDFNCLLIDLEENTLEEKPTDIKVETVSVGASDCNSILDETSVNVLDEIEEVEQPHDEDVKDIDYKYTDKCEILNETTMSREAKYAIIETLQDMKVTRSSTNMYRMNNKENSSASTLHKSVGMQKRLRDNRSKYDQYMRERTNTMTGINLHGQTRNRKSNSVYSSDDESDCCDETSSSEKDNTRTNLLPSIGNIGSRNKVSNKTKIYSLEQAKRKKYKIPGIGNYDLVMSPEVEFEITPPGFDSRYNPRPIISKDEMEPPPRLIRERSIQKCKKWLKNVNLSPLSLNPVNKQ